MLRLPKDLDNHPHLRRLEAYLAQSLKPLRAGGDLQILHLTWTPAMGGSVRTLASKGHLEQGLEHIAKVLDREKHGLLALHAKAGGELPRRLSRLLLLACDGSERFYHNAESLLRRHDDRLHGIVLDIDAEALGREVSPKGRPLKALLIKERQAVGLFLGALAETLAPAGGS